MLINLSEVQLKLATDDTRGNVQSFLDRLLNEVASENYRYFLAEYTSLGWTPEDFPEHHCWPPLLSNERQVSGLFATGLAHVSPISRPEHPVSRAGKASDDDHDDEESRTASKHGRIDFLAYFGNRHIALELKRHAISTVGDVRSNKKFVELWGAVSKQSKEALRHMREHKDQYYSPVSIGLLAMRVGRKVTSRKEIDETQKDATGSLSTIADEVRKTTKADYISYYVAPKEMQVSYGWGKAEDGYCVFPGVVFAAVVHGSTK